MELGADLLSLRPSNRRAPSSNLGTDAIFRPLDGKFAIITGGSRGIGEAVAHNLASKGCSLLLVYTSDSSTEPTKNICTLLNSSYGIVCQPCQADLSDPTTSVPHIIDTAKSKFSKGTSGKFQIDILINNAGIAANKFLNDREKGAITAEDFDKQYRVNVLAPLLLTQAAAEYFPTDRSGRIVNVSSTSASAGCESQSVYAGTKAAIEAMTRVWARELAERCTVNAINPGPVWGDMYSNAKDFWAINQKYIDQAPLMNYTPDEALSERSGDPKEYDRLVMEEMGGKRPAFTFEIAGVVGMLCSKDAAWTTGSIISANGGMKMSIA